MHSVNQPTRRLTACLKIAVALTLAVVPAALLTGCTSVAGSTPVSRVRVIDVSKNAPGLDAYVTGKSIADDIVYPSVTNYAYEGPDTVTVKLDEHGSNTVLESLTATLEPNTQYSVLVADQGKNYAATVLTDQSAAAPSGDVSFRFLQQATAAGRVNIYVVPDGTALAEAKPLFSSLAPRATTDYVNLPVGNYDIAIAPGGVIKNAFISPATTFASGQARTILILDQQLLTKPPVTILVANDVD